MSKLIEQNPPKKSRFLKYSLLASISVGAIIAAPFEGMASSEVNKEYDTVKRDESSSGLLKPVQRAQSMNSQKRKMERERRKTVSFAGVDQRSENAAVENKYSHTPTNVPKIIVTDLSSVAPPEVQNNTPFLTPPISSEQATTTSERKEGQSIVTISYKPVVPPSTEDQFITAPSTPNTTPLLSTPPTLPHIYQTPPTTPGTPYEKTPESKPNVGVNNTPPKLGIAVDLSKKWEQEKRDTQTKSIILPKPSLPIKKSSTQVVPTQSTPLQRQQLDVNTQQEQLRQNITTEKTKKQLKKERQKQQRAENTRKEENQQKEKARKIVNIKSDIKQTMQQISNTNTTPNRLEELESKVNTIKDKEQKKAAQKQLSEIKKQEKAIKKAVDKANVVAASAKDELDIAKLEKQQTKINDHLATVKKNSDIEAKRKNLELLIPNPPTPPSIATIPHKQQQLLTTGPTMPLTPGVQGILNSQENDGYLVPNQAQQSPYLEVLPPQQAAQQPESFDSGFGSLPNRNVPHTQTNLSIGSKLTEKAAGILIGLEDQINKIQQAKITNPTESKSLDQSLKKVLEYKQKVINIQQELQQKVINNPQDVEIYSAAEKQYDHIKNKTDKFFNKIETDAAVSKSTAQAVSLDLKTLEFLGYQDNLTQTLDTVARADSIKRPILFQNLLKDLEGRKQEAKAVLEQARIHKINNPDDNEAKEPIALVPKLIEKYDADIELVKKALEDNKENNRKNNNVQKLSSPDLAYLGLEEKFAPLRKYDALDEKLQKVTAFKNAAEEQYATLRAQNPKDPQLDQLARGALNLSEEEAKLKQAIKAIDPLFQDSGYSDTGGSEPSRPYSVGDISSVLSYTESNLSRSSSVNSLSSDLSWDDAGDTGVGYKYGRKDSCPTTDLINFDDDINTNDPTTSIENKIALLQTYQMAVTVKRQELEQLPSTSSGDNQIAQKIEELKKEEVTMHDAINACIADPSKLNNVSFEEINENLKRFGAGIPESVINVLESKAQEDPEDILDGSLLQTMLASDDDSESPAGYEESEDGKVTEGVIQESGKQLSSLPALASSNECALGDGSEDEDDDNDSGIDSESEEEAVEQLSDSSEDNLKATEVDTAIPQQEATEKLKNDIATTVPTLNQVSQIGKAVSNLISARFDTAAIGAGDEEETRIKRGLWVRGMYGINNQGRVENFNGYRGINKGATIGFDVEIDNNIVGIAYSNVHSVFKFKNSKNNDKEIIDSHVVSIYGQKELPKDFALQALISASKNFIKDKTTYSYGDSKIKSNVKHRNHSYNAEALLNYNYFVKNNLVITPNIGLRYGKSRDGVYNETGINVQEIALTMKENNILSGIVGTKVKVPLKDALKFNNLGLTFQGAVEHNFKEKTQRINRVVKIFDTEFKQDYAIPKQPKTSYNLGTGITGSIKNTTISLDYNYYLNKHYRSHQGSVKLKVNL